MRILRCLFRHQILLCLFAIFVFCIQYEKVRKYLPFKQKLNELGQLESHQAKTCGKLNTSILLCPYNSHQNEAKCTIQ